MICKKCKKEIDENSKFCEFCGTKTKPVVSQDVQKLNKKKWYRAIKVLYFLGIALGLLLAIGIGIDESNPLAFFAFAVTILAISEIIKRSFFYIYFGRLFPKYDN